MTRVLVIASSPVVRAGLEAVLREDARFSVLASAPIGNRGECPDVLLVDSGMPARNGYAGAIRDGGAPAVLLADHLGRPELRRLLHSGVRAILPRDAAAPEILAAVESVAAGLVVLSNEDMDALLPPEISSPALEPIPGEALSARELEVLAMLAEGLGNREISARLKISEHTVKFHVSSILGKLGVASRGEAVARGVREGLVVI